MPNNVTHRTICVSTITRISMKISKGINPKTFVFTIILPTSLVNMMVRMPTMPTPIPLTTYCMPSVAISGDTWSLDTRMPLIAPISAPTARDSKRLPRNPSVPFSVSVAERTAVTYMVEDTDISIPPVSITNSSPQAQIPEEEIC